MIAHEVVTLFRTATLGITGISQTQLMPALNGELQAGVSARRSRIWRETSSLGSAACKLDMRNLESRYDSSFRRFQLSSS